MTKQSTLHLPEKYVKQVRALLHQHIAQTVQAKDNEAKAKVSAVPIPPQTGIALIAVLWLVAALTIAVTGISHSVRGEVQVVAAGRDSVQAQALGEAAIALTLQQLVVRTPLPSYQRQPVSYQGHSIMVEAAVLNGWVDLNKAELPLLEQVYRVAGGLPPQAALSLASATVQARTRRDAQGRPLEFEAVQDLLHLPGVDYDLYARLAPLLTTDARGSGRVNVWAAPLQVLTVLADGNIARAQALHTRRLQSNQSNLGMDTTAFAGAFIDQATNTRYRLQAQVPLADGAVAQITRDVDIRPDTRVGLLWRMFRAEDALHLAPATGATGS